MEAMPKIYQPDKENGEEIWSHKHGKIYKEMRLKKSKS